MHSTYRSFTSGSVMRTAAALLITAVATACRDLPAPADPIARPMSATASARATVYEPDFDTYSASVVVSMTGGGMRQLPATGERRLEYNVERTLDRGGWTTTYEFSGVREAGTLRRVPIRRVVSGLDGMRYYDHNGDLIPLGKRLPDVPNGADFPPLPEGRPRAHGAGGNPRAWAANLVTSASLGAERRAEIERSFQRAGTRGRTVKYRKERDGLVIEVVLDTTRGTLEEAHTSRGGRYRSSTRFEYRDIGHARWMRVRSVQRHEETGGERHPLTVEQVFVDQRFHRAEGR